LKGAGGDTLLDKLYIRKRKVSVNIIWLLSYTTCTGISIIVINTVQVELHDNNVRFDNYTFVH
jgi:hypothetical protein